MSRTDVMRVWAPKAERVDLVRGAGAGAEGPERIPVAVTMARSADGNGWWTSSPLSSPDASGEFSYGFSIDGGPALPDPRSAWQPDGVHGLSRTFDTSAHQWHDEGWAGPRDGAGVLGGVIYELHIGTFTEAGTFAAAIEHLDHLVRLGVDVVEVMPVAAFGGAYGWGYDGVAPYAVHDAYGGPSGFQDLVDACHQRGLGVCLDVVYNHLGPTGNYLAQFGPYFTDRHVTPWGPAVNLDADGSQEVRRWIIDNALRWFADFHVDALRIDAAHELRDDGEVHLLAELSDEVAQLARRAGRSLDLIAESDLNDPVMVTPTGGGGRGMTAQWDDDIHHALHVALTGEIQGYYADFGGGTEALPDGGPIEVLAKTLTEVFLHDGRISTFREKQWGAPVDQQSHSGHQFLAYLQTHDQVGNRATGDRIGHGITLGQQAIGAALYLLSPYTAMIFMGEEWRASTPFQFFTDFEEDWLAEAVRTGRRSEFAAHGWAEADVPDPQDAATRAASVLRWSELAEPEHALMLDFYSELIALRRSQPDLASGDLTRTRVDFDETQRWLVMHRGSVLVAVNFSQAPQTIEGLLSPDSIPNVLAGWGNPDQQDVRAGGIRLDGHGVLVLGTHPEVEPTAGLSAP